MAPGARPPGPATAEEVVESGFPGGARPVRHHGRDTSRRDHFTRAGELDPGWTAAAPGGPLRPDAETATEERGPPGPLCGWLCARPCPFEMRVGPSEPACGGRLQTTESGSGQEPRS